MADFYPLPESAKTHFSAAYQNNIVPMFHNTGTDTTTFLREHYLLNIINTNFTQL